MLTISALEVFEWALAGKEGQAPITGVYIIPCGGGKVPNTVQRLSVKNLLKAILDRKNAPRQEARQNVLG